MLTPHDIETKKFDKGFRGYNIADVNEFMQLMLQDFEKLYKENLVLKNKITVLVDKIEEYKKVEDSLRNALISAQKMGESMIREAQTKGDMIVSEANIKSERLMNSLNMQIYKERQKLEEAKREYYTFKVKLISIYNSQISLLESLPSIEKEVELAFQTEEMPLPTPDGDHALEKFPYKIDKNEQNQDDQSKSNNSTSTGEYINNDDNISHVGNGQTDTFNFDEIFEESENKNK